MKLGLRRRNKNIVDTYPKACGKFLDAWTIEWAVGDDDPVPDFMDDAASKRPRPKFDTSTAPDTVILSFPNVLEWTDPEGKVRRAASTPAILKAMFKDGLVMLRDKYEAATRRGFMKFEEIDNYRHAMDSMVLKGLMAAIEWAETMQEQLLRRCYDTRYWIGWFRESDTPARWMPVLYDVVPYPTMPMAEITVKYEGDKYTRSEQARPILLGPAAGARSLPNWVAERLKRVQVIYAGENGPIATTLEDKSQRCENGSDEHVREDEETVSGWVPTLGPDGTWRFTPKRIPVDKFVWDCELGRVGFDDIPFPALGMIAVSFPKGFDPSRLSSPSPLERERPFMSWFERAVMPLHRSATRSRIDQVSKTAAGKLMRDTVRFSDSSLAHWLDLAASDGGEKIIPPCVMERYILQTGRDRSDDPHSSLSYYRPVLSSEGEAFMDKRLVDSAFGILSPFGRMVTDTGDVLGGRNAKSWKIGNEAKTGLFGLEAAGASLGVRRQICENLRNGTQDSKEIYERDDL